MIIESHSIYENVKNRDVLEQQDVIDIEDKLKTAKVQIEASHAGIVNGNDMFYTPRALSMGSVSLTFPFNKHVQSKHYSDAVGVVYASEYKDDSKPSKYKEKIDQAKTPKQLITAVNQYLDSSEYKERAQKGLGTLYAKAELYNAEKIQDLKERDRGTVSIGGQSDTAYCNICAKVYGTCDHKKGRTYSGRKAIAVVNSLNIDHIGFETIPADWATASHIINDSANSGIELEIIDYNCSIQDKQGPSMKLTTDQLKSKVSDDGIENHLKDMGLHHRVNQYKTDKASALDSDYVFPEEKLLPLHTPLTATVAKQSVDMLEDGDDKDTANAAIKAFTDVHFPHPEDPDGDGDCDSYFESLKAIPSITNNAIEDIADVVQEAIQTAVHAAVAETVNGDVLEPMATKLGLQVQDEDQFLTSILDSLDSRLEAKFKDLEDRITATVTAKYESESKNLAQEQIKALRSDLENKKIVEAQLTEKTKQAIIGQIVLVEDIQQDSEYLTILNGRTVEQLQNTLQDILYLSRETKPVVAAISDSHAPIEEPVIEEIVEPVVIPVLDSEQVTLDTALNTMADVVDLSTTEIRDNLEIQDSLALIIKDNSEKELTPTQFKAAYVSVYKSHGSIGAKRFHNEMKALNKIPKSK